MVNCYFCGSRSSALRRSSSGRPSCKECFIESFENEVYDYIKLENLISEGDRICIGVSGGKDSSVLAHVLSNIKTKHNLNWNLYLLAIDEGIKGYRDDSLRVVHNMYQKYKIELKILNFKDRYGFTMDQVVGLIGNKNNCTVCGSFRRQILEVGSRLFGANVLCTGHNADDMAETVLLNFVRGDIYKLAKTIQTDGHGLEDLKIENISDSLFNNHNKGPDSLNFQDVNFENDFKNNVKNNKIHGDLKQQDIDSGRNSKSNELILDKSKKKLNFRRIKPLLYCFEKEIVLYARFLSLEYFSTECVYAPDAYRMQLRSFVKNLEVVNPRIILNIVHSGKQFYSNYTPIDQKKNYCKRCGIEDIKNICKPCVIVEKLNMLERSKEESKSIINGNYKEKNENKDLKIENISDSLFNNHNKGPDSQVTTVLKSRKSISKNAPLTVGIPF